MQGQGVTLTQIPEFCFRKFQISVSQSSIISRRSIVIPTAAGFGVLSLDRPGELQRLPIVGWTRRPTPAMTMAGYTFCVEAACKLPLPKRRRV
jgi:hypothetical protein